MINSAVRKYEIPRTLQPKVCMCDEGYTTHHGTERKYRLMNHCSNCIKPFRWYILRCVHCEKPYIRDFRDKHFCPRHAACWDCSHNGTVDLSIQCCESWSTYKDWQMFEPLGMNPRKISEEAMASVFDRSPSDYL